MQKMLNYRFFTYRIKITVYEKVLRPIVTYGSETLVLSKASEKKLPEWERGVLRIYGQVCEHGQWRICINEELHQNYDKPNLVSVVKGNQIWFSEDYSHQKINKFANIPAY